jgi:pimeloyl-ACP methyl ester carboxylesterase
MNGTKEYRVESGGETLACSVDWADEAKRPDVIFLHGAGPSNRHHAAYLSEVFLARGQNVVRFDYSGQGESSGLLSESSLAKKQRETIDVIEHFDMDTDNLTVVGTSMGGYVAASLAKIYPLKNLILFCPAAYDRIAWDVRFDQGFTEILRRDLSMLVSDVDELLAGFAGASLLALAERDEVIPEKVVTWYRDALGGKTRHAEYVIRDCPHPIHRWVADKEEEKARIRDAVRKTIDS